MRRTIYQFQLSIPFRMLRAYSNNSHNNTQKGFQFLLGCYKRRDKADSSAYMEGFQFLLGCYWDLDMLVEEEAAAFNSF